MIAFIDAHRALSTGSSRSAGCWRSPCRVTTPMPPGGPDESFEPGWSQLVFQRSAAWRAQGVVVGHRLLAGLNEGLSRYFRERAQHVRILTLGGAIACRPFYVWSRLGRSSCACCGAAGSGGFVAGLVVPGVEGLVAAVRAGRNGVALGDVRLPMALGAAEITRFSRRLSGVRRHGRLHSRRVRRSLGAVVSPCLRSATSRDRLPRSPRRARSARPRERIRSAVLPCRHP